MAKRKKKSRAAKASPRKAIEPALVVVSLGQAVAIEYRREKDGKTYRHQFGNGVRLLRSRDGRVLLISPVKVSDFIRG